MSEKEFQFKLAEDIGYIRGKVEKLDAMESRLLSVEKKMNRILGYAAGVAGVVGIAIAFTKDFFARRFFGEI